MHFLGSQAQVNFKTDEHFRPWPQAPSRSPDLLIFRVVIVCLPEGRAEWIAFALIAVLAHPTPPILNRIVGIRS